MKRGGGRSRGKREEEGGRGRKREEEGGRGRSGIEGGRNSGRRKRK